MRLPYLNTDNKGVLIHEPAALTRKVRDTLGWDTREKGGWGGRKGRGRVSLWLISTCAYRLTCFVCYARGENVEDMGKPTPHVAGHTDGPHGDSHSVHFFVLHWSKCAAL